jgi:D-amino-acid dehydrogenase
VIAAGCHSRQLLAALGIHAPIYPIKGYSITAPIVDESKVNNASITDHSKRLVFTRLGESLRVAGFAEFAGYDTSVPAERASLLQRCTQQMLPDAVDMSRATTWAGLRPGLPHSVPMLGRSKTISNLHLNTGHGMLGWTMAHGTARIVADGIRQL